MIENQHLKNVKSFFSPLKLQSNLLSILMICFWGYSNNLHAKSTINFIQDHEVKGKVVDETGTPLIGVSIIVKGTPIGVSSDFDGNYSIKVPDAQSAVLVYSFVGFATQEIALKGKNLVNVKLLEDLSQLDDVVVVGFGKQKN